MSTWMVVEDEPDIYEVLLAMFEMWGIEGVAFVDGEEAIEWIDDVDSGHYQGDLPELALLDVRLPGDVWGHIVGERLRKSPVLGNIAIVLTSGYRLTVEEHEECMRISGADYWLPKPLPRFNELQSLLENVIAIRRAGLVTTSKDTSKPPTTITPKTQNTSSNNASSNNASSNNASKPKNIPSVKPPNKPPSEQDKG